MKNFLIADSDYEALKRICDKYGTSLEDLFHRLIVYPDLTENALQLPLNVTVKLSIATMTTKKLLPLWIDNISNNLEAIRIGKDINDIQTHQKTEALVIGAGPSLKQNNHLELLAEKKFGGTIFATDRILKDCLNAHIIPDYVIIIDGSEKIVGYIDYDIVDDYADKLTALMATQVHPSVVNRWNGDIYWFNTAMDDVIVPNVNAILSLLTKKTPIPTAGHASSVGWNASAFLKYSSIILIGVDLSYPLNTPIEETWYYNGYLQQCEGDKNKVRQLFYKDHHHTIFATDCYYEPMFESYISTSIWQLKELAKAGIKIYNCTEGGAIEGEGIKCLKFINYLG